MTDVAGYLFLFLIAHSTSDCAHLGAVLAWKNLLVFGVGGGRFRIGKQTAKPAESPSNKDMSAFLYLI